MGETKTMGNKKKFSYDWWYDIGYQDAKNNRPQKSKVKPYLDGYDKWEEECLDNWGNTDFITQ